MGVNELIRTIDTNINHMISLSVLNLAQLGIKYGIFKAVASRPSYAELLSQIQVPNKPLLKRLIEHLKALGIIEETPNSLILNGFSYVLTFPKEDYMLLLSDWIPLWEEIYKMIDFALISYDHPYVLMDFDKDADFWDLRLSSSFNKIYRDVIVNLGEINRESYVLDLGCGSVSPSYFGKFISEDGKYLGVDYSPGLLEIARQRVEREGLPVELKEMDVSLIKPRTKYDVAIMSFLLEYVKDRREVLRKVLEALDSGGKLVIVDAFRDEFKNIEAMEFFEGLNSSFVGYPGKEEVKRIILEEGFDVSFEDYGKSVLLVRKL
ncbi:class I SAM-dependent methyltransferase [Pyrococcus abyssi]|uniref:Methyltransferase n=1 Tax=Pyrococcus abyssi (strain GE5 / Orsay) TaxID=272844 RepID=Q9UYL1_PYRAB|nr:class I SAM-dependent methyltransferase [Pyrococcus abyssi]CAB50401.1 SAM-dependent methyltransferase [Pyrococcus abyssi GE5]CCE70948.1 TPA: Methyltransferase [Pyrococcus abyssi GE5]